MHVGRVDNIHFNLAKVDPGFNIAVVFQQEILVGQRHVYIQEFAGIPVTDHPRVIMLYQCQFLHIGDAVHHGRTVVTPLFFARPVTRPQQDCQDNGRDKEKKGRNAYF
jgi:hypothetical protein